MIAIRDETSNDRDHVRRITIDAFAKSKFGHNGEAELIDSLRVSCSEILSLVACSGSEIIGHVLFTPVVISTSTNNCVGMGLAPLSVMPSYQNTGVGSTLVTTGLRRLRDDSCPFVVVLGYPRYYTRFGFGPATQLQITHGFEGLPQEVFLILSDAAATMFRLKGGKAYYHSVFGPQHHGQ